jgi:hypothetical protein
MTTGSHQTFEAHIETYNSGSKAFSFSPTLLYKPDGTGSFIDTEDPFATSSNIPTTIGQFEPGTYVVSNNNLTNVTSSKTSERLEQGTNGTIEIHEDYLDPSRRDPNAYNNQACQAPVRPFTNDPLLGYGIGFGAIGSSFVLGNWTQFGSNIAVGIGFSTIGQNFTVSNYVGGINIFTIGTATIGSTFVVGTYSVTPRRDFNYIPHKSNVLLGNIIGGKKSKKYFKYTTYSL